MNYDKNPNFILKGQSPEQIALLNSDIKDNYFIDVQQDLREPTGEDGNNVVLEEEMMDEAKNGMQYQVVASLLSKSYSLLGNIIKGQNQ